MILSAKGLRLIKNYEGLRLFAYLDAVGYLTVGYGHLVKPSDKIKLAQKITQADADRLLIADTADAQNAVRNLVKVPLNQNQFDALTSLVFNIGTGNFRKSTVLKMLNQKKYDSAADSFLRHVFAKGIKLKGLVRRRNEERNLFLSTINK